MELESSYDLLGVIRDDGIRTFRAIEKSSGQELQVHLFAKPDSETDRALFRALRALPVSKRRELLELGTEGNMPYVVTESLPEGPGARDWLMKLAGIAPTSRTSSPSNPIVVAGSWKTGTPIPEELIRASQSSNPPVPPTPKKPVELSADYTRVMRIPQMPPPPPAGAAEPVKPEAPPSRPVEASVKPKPIPPLEPSPKSAPAPDEDDEFARLFLNPPRSESAILLGDPPKLPAADANSSADMVTGKFKVSDLFEPGPPPSQPRSTPPGEFTSQFLAGRPPEPAAPPPTKPVPVVSQPAAPPTINPPPQLSDAVVSPYAEPAVERPDEKSAPLTTPDKQPGEFTGQFLAAQRQEAVKPEPPKAAPPSMPAEGSFTGTFLSPKAPEPPPPAKQPAPFAPPQAQQPGEFTSMFLAGKPLEPAQTTFAPPPEPPAQPAPGEFTSMFLAAKPPERAQTEASRPLAAQTEQPPGEFTSLFLSAKPQEPAAPIQPPKPLIAQGPSDPAGFTSQFFGQGPQGPPTGPVTPGILGGGSGMEGATRLYQPMQPPVQPVAPPPHLQANASPVVQPPPVQIPPDEPTRLFQAVPPSTVTPPGTISPPIKGNKDPGAFTQMFPPVTPAGASLGSGPAPKETPGDYDFFQSPLAPTPAGNQRPPQTPVMRPTTRPSAEPGEFTRIFGSINKGGPASPPPPASPAPPLGSGSASGIFASPTAPPARPANKPSDAGDFTRMMSAPSTPTLGQPPAQPKAQPEAVEPKKKSNLLLYVAGGAVVLAIILIVVFFFLMRQ